MIRHKKDVSFRQRRNVTGTLPGHMTQMLPIRAEPCGKEPRQAELMAERRFKACREQRKNRLIVARQQLETIER